MSDRRDAGMTRRALLGMGVAALVPGAGRSRQAAQEPSAPLPRPDMAGRPRSRVTDYENDPFIVGVEAELRCTCGCNLSVYTCRTTDFTCQTSPAMHQEVIALVERGMTAEEILDEFVVRHGETVLMAPRKRGFNIAAYVVPGIAITAVGGVLLWVLARRTRLGPVAAQAATTDDPGDHPGMSPEEAARLQAELERLEV